MNLFHYGEESSSESEEENAPKTVIAEKAQDDSILYGLLFKTRENDTCRDKKHTCPFIE